MACPEWTCKALLLLFTSPVSLNWNISSWKFSLFYCFLLFWAEGFLLNSLWFAFWMVSARANPRHFAFWHQRQNGTSPSLTFRPATEANWTVNCFFWQHWQDNVFHCTWEKRAGLVGAGQGVQNTHLCPLTKMDGQKAPAWASPYHSASAAGGYHLTLPYGRAPPILSKLPLCVCVFCAAMCAQLFIIYLFI